MSFTISKKELTENPTEYSKQIPGFALGVFIQKCNSAYENGKPIVSDYIYDEVFAVFKEKFPEHPLVKKIGHEPSQDKVALPIHMGSMDKKLDQKSIQKWLNKYQGPEYVVSSKLDGASGLLVKQSCSLNLFSRGNGRIGRNLNHLIKYLKIPDIPKDYIIRGELIVAKKNKGEQYTNARSMINGIMGRKTVSDENNVIEFVVYNLHFYDKMDIKLPLLAQLKILKKLGFNVVKHSVLEGINLSGKIEDSILSKTLLEYRLDSEYDIDGIIVTDNGSHEVNKSGNPVHAFAFKSNGMGEVTNVLKVDWNISKHGYLIPRLKVEPVTIEGTKIQYATAFNAKYVLSNRIGPGTKVRIIRSGDVIPYVIEIIEPTEAQMPETEYNWTESGVNIIVAGGSKELNLKKMEAFVKTLGIPFMSSGNLKKLYDCGIDSILKLISVTPEELLAVDGIQKKMANKLYQSIHNVIDNPILLEKLMTASLCFGHGFGEKKLKSIIDYYPDILTNKFIDIEALTLVPGVSKKTAEKVCGNIHSFNNWLNEYPFLNFKIEKSEGKGDRYKGKIYVFSGVRDKDLEQKIEQQGGKIASQVTKKTTAVIIKNETSHSSKVTTAELLGIPLITISNFI